MRRFICLLASLLILDGCQRPDPSVAYFDTFTDSVQVRMAVVVGLSGSYRSADLPANQELVAAMGALRNGSGARSEQTNRALAAHAIAVTDYLGGFELATQALRSANDSLLRLSNAIVDEELRSAALQISENYSEAVRLSSQLAAQQRIGARTTNRLLTEGRNNDPGGSVSQALADELERAGAAFELEQQLRTQLRDLTQQSSSLISTWRGIRDRTGS